MVNVSMFQKSSEALQYLQSKIPPELRSPIMGVICGSGLGGLADTVLPQPRLEVDYKDIPHFPQSTSKVLSIYSIVFFIRVVDMK